MGRREVAGDLVSQCNRRPTTMRLLLMLLMPAMVSCLDSLHPAAIIPWSEYQKRVREKEDMTVRENEAEREAEKALNALMQQGADLGRLKPAPEYVLEGMLPQGERPAYSTGAVYSQPARPRPPKTRPPGHSVIRPQLRSRRPDEYAALLKNKGPKSLEPPHYNPPLSRPPFAMVDARTDTLPRGAIAAVKNEGVSPNLSPLHSLKRRPEPSSNLRPIQFGANTLGNSPLAEGLPALEGNALSSLTDNFSPAYSRIGPAPGPLGSGGSNIVNSIFSQSQNGLIPQVHGVAQEIPMSGIPNGVPSLPQFPNPLQTGHLPLGSSLQGLDNGIVAGGQRSPFEGLLANGSPLDQLSKLAKNMLGGQGGAGQGGNLLEAMTSALSGGHKPVGVGTATAIDPPILEAPRRAEPTLMEKLFSSAASALNESMKVKERQDKLDAIKRKEEEEKELQQVEQQKQARMSKNVQQSLKLLEGLPPEQKALLEQAMKSGEIDADVLAPAMKNLVKDDLKEDSQKEKADRLLEWIKANRPAKPAIVPLSTGDKLPYYGKYCGSLTVQEGQVKRSDKPSGAVWAVDKTRFIVSKFHFQPASLAENVTFWLGPNVSTVDLVADSFPSSNGFYVMPEPIPINVFVIEDLQPIPARVRKVVSEETTSSVIKPLSIFGAKRARRDAIIHVDRDELPPPLLSSSPDGVKRLVVAGGAVQVKSDNPLTPSVLSNALEVNGHAKENSIFSRIVPEGLEVRPPLAPAEYPANMVPLDWFAGFQPLLLTLPKERTVKSVNWIALRDHKHQETVASVIMPNGPGFTIPAMTQLRPLTPNGLFNISSGPIKVYDYKTIQITDFVLKAEGHALWFMIGTDILPNASGSIVPLYNLTTKSFDCDSLRDYNSETITLRLPGKKDINDVFWLSVFSIPSTLSFSHIYLPYNEMVIPPDLTGIPTPTCVYTP